MKFGFCGTKLQQKRNPLYNNSIPSTKKHHIEPKAGKIDLIIRLFGVARSCGARPDTSNLSEEGSACPAFSPRILVLVCIHYPDKTL
jgi:hypothetical protein